MLTAKAFEDQRKEGRMSLQPAAWLLLASPRLGNKNQKVTMTMTKYCATTEKPNKGLTGESIKRYKSNAEGENCSCFLAEDQRTSSDGENKLRWKRNRDTAPLIDCIKKRINLWAQKGLCLKIKNLISSKAFLSRQQK
ncbi:hypothetical protein AMECASPLE_037594 [Ameca splendens]|uniref:Uncharacterized protein n=1 Tax=Ameca splendens TaxID=208324 RepID=A0ABV0ZV09_9TELE